MVCIHELSNGMESLPFSGQQLDKKIVKVIGSYVGSYVTKHLKTRLK